MPDFLSTVIAALVGASVSVLTTLVNEFFFKRRRIEEQEERFFYNVYDRRVQCHERLLRIASEYFSHFVPALAPDAYYRYLNEFGKKFQTEILASYVIADENVLSTAEALMKSASDCGMMVLKELKTQGSNKKPLELDKALDYARDVAKAYNVFTKAVRESPGVDTIQRYLDRIANGGKAVKQKNGKSTKNQTKKPAQQKTKQHR